ELQGRRGPSGRRRLGHLRLQHRKRDLRTDHLCGARRDVQGAVGGPPGVYANRHRRRYGDADAAVRCVPPDPVGVRRQSGNHPRQPESGREQAHAQEPASAAVRCAAAHVTAVPGSGFRVPPGTTTIPVMLPTIAREENAVVMIDQRKLPAEEIYVRCETAAEVARAIKTMVIRGAPAIGVAAAMGLALATRKNTATGTQKLAADFQKTCELMAGTRPTAVNLFWAIER